MSDLESQLARIPRRTAPPEWRADILRAARAAAPATEAAPWWRRWLAPQPLALAGAWLLIAALRLSSAGDDRETKGSAPVPLAQLEARAHAQEQLIAELLDLTPPPPPKPPAPPAAVPPHRESRLSLPHGYHC